MRRPLRIALAGSVAALLLELAEAPSLARGRNGAPFPAVRTKAGPGPGPDGTDGEDHPPAENTYNLPDGAGLKGELLKWFRRQAKALLGTVPTIGAELPIAFASLADYDDPMSAAMTPMLAAYWDASGKRVRERLGLDPGEWSVVNPHTETMIHAAALDFCKATNATTTMQLGKALDRLRSELAAGIVTHGEALPELVKRVKGVFTAAEDHRAERIAASEASRAVHAAQLQAARETGIVAGLEWLISGDACPLCQQVATEARRVRLGEPFAIIGDHPTYSTVRHAPLHPGCQCTCLEVLLPQYGGPENPEWASPLVQPKPGKEYTPPPGEKVPEPEPERVGTPEAPRPILVDPGKPIGERIKLYRAGDEKLAAIRAVGAELGPEIAAAERAVAEAEARVSGYLARMMQLFNDRTAAQARGDAAAEARIVDERKRLFEASRNLEAEASKARAELARLAKARTERARAVLAIEPAARLAFSAAAPATGARSKAGPLKAPGPELQGRVDEALAWLGSITRKGDGPDGDGIKLRFGAAKGRRAHYALTTNLDRGYDVQLDAAEGTGVIVHEIGHSLEDRLHTLAGTAGKRRLLDVSREFLAHRVGSEVPQKLKKLFPDHRYAADETGREDDFAKAFGGDRNRAFYTGKDYGSKATEILSMGVERLYNDPTAFAEADPEYCKYVLGVLDGALR